MYVEIRNHVIAEVEKHIAEGDCPTPRSYSMEMLENVIADLLLLSTPAEPNVSREAGFGAGVEPQDRDDDETIAEFAFLWRNYALADDAELATDAKALKRKLIAALSNPPADGVGWRAPQVHVEFRQHDWMPGFAAFLPDETVNGEAFCVLNLGGFLGAVDHGDIDKADLAYLIAESMMHEIIHVLEKWAGVEFDEDKVEALLEKYRAAPPSAPLGAGGEG